MDGEAYAKWKSAIPLLYDWFSHHSLDCPALTCRLRPSTSVDAGFGVQRIYYAEQCEDEDPQVLNVATFDVCQPRVASGESISTWGDGDKCPDMALERQIYHPGEVNRVRECPSYPEVLVTNTDAAELYVWHCGRESAAAEVEGRRVDKAEMVLAGHTSAAPFALGTSSIGASVVSGGTDHKVLIWRLDDYATRLANGESIAGAPRLEALICLEGHTDAVEDVVFRPGSSEEVASVGDDHSLVFWDTRTGSAPTSCIAEAHGDQDMHCVDWSRSGHLIATGSTDGTLKVWDRRMTPSAAHASFSTKFHKSSVTRVEWDPHHDGVLASGGEDGVVCIWDLGQSRSSSSSDIQENKRARRSIPGELLFQHAGHKSNVADFQWNPSEPWTLLSAADHVDGSGGSLQLWRVSDFVYRSEDDVVEELQHHAKWIVSGKWENGETPRRREDDGYPAENGAARGD